MSKDVTNYEETSHFMEISISFSLLWTNDLAQKGIEFSSFKNSKLINLASFNGKIKSSIGHSSIQGSPTISISIPSLNNTNEEIKNQEEVPEFPT